MKDQYFGDVNDYRKYGLLRLLIETSGLKLGVCWLRTQPDFRRDGELREYLKQPVKWRSYDPELFDALERLGRSRGERSVLHAEKWSLLPTTTYHHEFIPHRRSQREKYFAEASLALADCKIVFFDPDNGMEVKSVSYGAARSLKYLYWRELQTFSLSHSVIVYQHFRRVPRDQFIKDMVVSFQENLSGDVYSFRTSHVVFFLIPHPEHEGCFQGVIEAVQKRWREQINPAHCRTALQSALDRREMISGSGLPA
jgi:hypothetical protein